MILRCPPSRRRQASAIRPFRPPRRRQALRHLLPRMWGGDGRHRRSGADGGGRWRRGWDGGRQRTGCGGSAVGRGCPGRRWRCRGRGSGGAAWRGVVLRGHVPHSHRRRHCCPVRRLSGDERPPCPGGGGVDEWRRGGGGDGRHAGCGVQDGGDGTHSPPAGLSSTALSAVGAPHSSGGVSRGCDMAAMAEPAVGGATAVAASGVPAAAGPPSAEGVAGDGGGSVGGGWVVLGSGGCPPPAMRPTVPAAPATAPRFAVIATRTGGMTAVVGLTRGAAAAAATYGKLVAAALSATVELPSTPPEDELPGDAAGPSSSSSVSGGGGIRSCSRACAVLAWRCFVAADGKERQQNKHLWELLEIEPPGGVDDMAPARVGEHSSKARKRSCAG